MIIGLPQEQHIKEYLHKRYGVNYLYKLFDLPLFTDGKNYYLGGYKNFYSVFVDDPHGVDIKQIISESKVKYPNIKFNFSILNLKQSTMSNFVFDIRKIINVEQRLSFYSKKVRNQVKKSYENSLEIKVGSVPEDFYILYVESMKRLGSFSKIQNWFSEQENLLSNYIVCFSLYDGKKLVGCNYCVLGKNIVYLMFNISDNTYWHYNINNRLYDELIKWSILNEYEFVDFGPSLTDDEQHNHFKVGFGARRMYLVDNQSRALLLGKSLFRGVRKFLKRFR